ncbi:PREDICTED: uncharacterized protein LOC105566352 [Vollenhovia emeryi]|uniref:uncharacterized protein LOC105566352 n=1 Tax=Vollenhovia emeryi TaxID=411798 RepID=UPI0005F41582|nr:PREDICTED: uncharacterized protein LOC105566352 [Vollenhovia emeryi]
MDSSKHAKVYTKHTKVDFEWAVRLNRIALDFIGLWPKTAQNTRQMLMCNFRVLIIFLGLTVGILIPAVHSLIRISGDIMLIMDNLLFTLPGISCALRIGIFWWKKEATIPIINMIAEDWLRLKSPQDRKIMIRQAKIARIIITCGFLLMGLACTFSIILPRLGISVRLLSNITDLIGRPMIVQSYYIYDITKRPLYELTYTIQGVFIVFSVIGYSGIDNFLGLLVFHICGQLDILKNRLTRLDKYVKTQDTLKSCVIRHTRLIKAIEIIEDTYNIILLVLLVYFALLFAFLGFRIINVSVETFKDKNLFINCHAKRSITNY